VMGVVIELECHVLGVDHGVWCDDCLLPSAVTVRYVIAGRRSLRVVARGEFTRCVDCGQ
jgi:hypothetical protein